MNLRIVTHSGEDVIVVVDTYNAEEYEQKLNSNEISFIEIGGIIFSRIDIKLIMPVIEEIETK